MTQEARTPYWLSQKDIAALRKCCMEEESHPLATAVLTEIDVARTRATSTPTLAKIGIALGYDRKATPVHLSASEVAYLLAWETLPARTRKRLA